MPPSYDAVGRFEIFPRTLIQCPAYRSAENGLKQRLSADFNVQPKAFFFVCSDFADETVCGFEPDCCSVFDGFKIKVNPQGKIKRLQSIKSNQTQRPCCWKHDIICYRICYFCAHRNMNKKCRCF
jgi:hypothetical protein